MCIPATIPLPEPGLLLPFCWPCPHHFLLNAAPSIPATFLPPPHTRLPCLLYPALPALPLRPLYLYAIIRVRLHGALHVPDAGKRIPVQLFMVRS